MNTLGTIPSLHTQVRAFRILQAVREQHDQGIQIDKEDVPFTLTTPLSLSDVWNQLQLMKTARRAIDNYKEKDVTRIWKEWQEQDLVPPGEDPEQSHADRAIK